MNWQVVLASCGLALAIGGGVARGESPHSDRKPDPVTDPTQAEVNIAIGGTQLISARGIRNYSEGSPGIIDVKLTSDNSQFVVSGRKAGSTTLLLIHTDGTQESYLVTVFARSPSVVEQEVRQLLGGISTVRVNRIGAQTVVDGYVQDQDEMKRVEQVLSLYKGQASSVITLGYSNASAPPEHAKSSRTVLIRIDFYFVQLDLSSSYAFGIAWPRSIGGAAAGNAALTFDFLARATTQATLTIAQPLPQLDISEDNGWSKVLRHATVVTNNGQEASFESGGEQNFTANTGLSVGLQKVNYGLEIGVVPRFDPLRDEVELSVKANVSDLTAPGSGSTIPGRTTTQLTSAVSVKLGQSIVLSGIRSMAESRHTNGLPLLSRLPIIGVLFGSHQGTDTDSESALYIIPSVMDSVPDESQELVERAVARFRDYAGELKGAPVLPPAHRNRARSEP